MRVLVDTLNTTGYVLLLYLGRCRLTIGSRTQSVGVSVGTVRLGSVGAPCVEPQSYLHPRPSVQIGRKVRTSLGMSGTDPQTVLNRHPTGFFTHGDYYLPCLGPRDLYFVGDVRPPNDEEKTLSWNLSFLALSLSRLEKFCPEIDSHREGGTRLVWRRRSLRHPPWSPRQ